MKRRDLTFEQLKYRMAKAGIRPDMFGYWKLSNGTTLVYARNGGNRRRDQERYLLKEDERTRQNS